MNLGSEFIRLPWRFDATRLATELAQFPDTMWMSHPDGTPGNTALALIAQGGGDNNEFRGGMQPTPHLRRCEYVQQVIASFDEIFGRSRFMRLAAGAEVVLHADAHHHWQNHLRIHIPVVTQPQVLFHCGEATVHMAAGECWIFDSWQPHRVVNGGDAARTHLVIDTSGSSRFWQLAADALAATRTGQPLPERYLPHEPGRSVNIETERYNMQPVMSPGEVDGLTEELIRDFERVEDNDPEEIGIYRRLMRGFCKDWRALWYRFGMHHPGWAHYAHLVAETNRALPESDPPLMMGNGMSTVKSAFAGRVLSVALSRGIYREFMAPVRAPAGDSLLSARSPATKGRTPVLPSAAAKPLAPSPTLAPADAVTAPASRNDPCPCGSGQRFKHCHGR